MNFAFIKKAPKIFLVAGILIGSTVMFWFWWQSHKAAKSRHPGTAPVAQIEKRVPVDFAANLGNYFMAGDDLYDAVAGQLVAKNFLNGEQPLRLVYEPQSKKLIGVFPGGFKRFGLDGQKEAELFPAAKAAFTPDSKKLIYAKAGDVWFADVDLVQFKFLNEHKVTSIGQFDDPYFADNILLFTEKYALWGIGNRHARIDLETGQVKPMKVQLPVNAKTRSPDSQVVVGILNNRLMSYDFDHDQGNELPLGRAMLSDSLWLDTNRCLLLINRSAVAMFDRRQQKPSDICVTPIPVRRLAEPSPGARYVFCGGDNGAGLIDVEQKTFVPLGIDAQTCCWLDGGTMLCSWEGMDTDRRGTWIKNVGGAQILVSEEPFLVNGTPIVLALERLRLTVFQTRKGLQTVKFDGTGIKRLELNQVAVFKLLIIARGK